MTKEKLNELTNYLANRRLEILKIDGFEKFRLSWSFTKLYNKKTDLWDFEIEVFFNKQSRVFEVDQSDLKNQINEFLNRAMKRSKV